MTALSLRYLERAAVNACRNSCRMRHRAYGHNTGQGQAYDWRSDVQVRVYVVECESFDGTRTIRWAFRRYSLVGKPGNISRREAAAVIAAAQQQAAA